MPAATYPVTAIGSEIMIPVLVSFETNEVGSFKLPLLPYRYRLTKIKSAVVKTVAGSNDGTIDVKKGATSYGQITVAASAAIGDEDADTSVTQTAFELDEQMTITTAKSTAGGRCMLYIFVEVLPSH